MNIGRERWTKKQHLLEGKLHLMSIGDVLDCEDMTPQECREVALASQSVLTLAGKRFLSVRLGSGQAVKRIT